MSTRPRGDGRHVEAVEQRVRVYLSQEWLASGSRVWVHVELDGLSLLPAVVFSGPDDLAADIVEGRRDANGVAIEPPAQEDDSAAPPDAPRAEVIDLMAALKASLAKLDKGGSRPGAGTEGEPRG